MSNAISITPPRTAAITAVLLASCLGLMVAQIDTSVVNLALAAMARDLHAGVVQLQWVVDGYNLVYGGLLLTGGTLGDLFGRKRIFLFGLALFCAGSVLCAMAPDVATLVAGRLVTGLGAALELPATLSIITVAYPDPEERAHAIGLWAGVNGLAFVIGPTVGGVLVNAAGWRSVFWIVVPFALAGILVAARAVGESSDRHGRRLDIPGQVPMVASITGFTLAAIQGRGWGWTSTLTLGCAAASLVAGIAFLLVEGRSLSGLLPLALFRSAHFSGALVVVMAMTFGMYGMLFILPMYLQEVRGGTPFAAGLEMLPMSAIFFLVSRRSGQLTRWLGVRAMMAAGMACMGGGNLALGWIGARDDMAWVELAMAVVGVGLGLNTAPVVARVIASVPRVRAGTASGIANTARIVGATLGVAILGALFASHLPQSGAANFLAGMRSALTFGGATLLLGGIVALATGGRRPQG